MNREGLLGRHAKNLDALEKKGKLTLNKQYLLGAMENLDTPHLQRPTEYLMKALNSQNKSTYIDDIVKTLLENYEDSIEKLCKEYKIPIVCNAENFLKRVANNLLSAPMWELYSIYAAEPDDIILPLSNYLK